MKVTFFPTAFYLACLFACTTADITLNPFPATVTVGETYTLSWTATVNYTYTLWLVLNEQEDSSSYDWVEVYSLGTGLDFASLTGSYTWTVPSNLSLESTYALWLDGLDIPFDGAGYAAITNWFGVTFSSTSPSNSGTAASTPGASSDSTSMSNSNHHETLSGGAIAGIVIGCMVVVAMLIGAVLLFIRRRKQAGVKRREAEARANRLAPVMQENFPGYEMHTRPPSAG